MTRKVVGEVKRERQVWKPEVFFTSVFYFSIHRGNSLGGREITTSLQLNERICVKLTSHSMFPYHNKQKRKESDKSFNNEIAKSTFPTTTISSMSVQQ